MSKRFKNFPAGDRKRPKLDITFSDHNFPLSQNLNPVSPAKASLPTTTQDDDWGDDSEDEILLLASQACEEAANASCLPDYTFCMQPSSTSTQLYNADTSFNLPNNNGIPNNLYMQPSTSKQHYNDNNASNVAKLPEKQDLFKKPTGIPTKDTPLASRPFNVEPTNSVARNSVNGNLQGEYLYKQYLTLQKDNQKLKTENGKLMDKCLTKDGEVTMLRQQLNASKVQVNDARVNKLKFHEKNQIEWNQKYNVALAEMQNLRTQLEFKNLEVANVKDRCRMLESNKVKLTSVPLPTSQQVMNFSQKLNSSFQQPKAQWSKPPSRDMCLQTEEALHTIGLNINTTSSPTLLREIPATIFEPTVSKQNLLSFVKTFQDSSNILETNSKVLENNCKKASNSDMRGCEENLKITCIQPDLSQLLRLTDDQLKDAVNVEKCINVGLVSVKFLKKTLYELENISRKTNAKFKREMDKRYLEDSKSYHAHISISDLFNGSPLSEDEQAIDTRRIVATVAVLCKVCPPLVSYITSAVPDTSLRRSSRDVPTVSSSIYLDLLSQICRLIGVISCTKWFTGFLISVLYLIEILAPNKEFMLAECYEKAYHIVRSVLQARPLTQVVLHAVRTVEALSSQKSVLELMCSGMESGNLRLDFDQGILLFNKESCFLQVFLNQLQVAMTVLEKADDVDRVLQNTYNLLTIYWNASALQLVWCCSHLPTRCLCSLRLAQTIILCFRICATMYKEKVFGIGATCGGELRCAMRTGLLLCNIWIDRDVEFTSQLGEYEGQYQIFVELCDQMREQIIADEIQDNILTDLLATLHPNCEDDDPVATQLNTLWKETFSEFSTTD